MFKSGKAPDIHTIRFLALVDSLYHASMTFLGKVADPVSGEVHRELEKAQVYIDFLAALQVKTKGNLGELEGPHLERLLADLRLNYVDEVNADKEKEKEKEKDEGNGGEETGDGPSGEADGNGEADDQ